MSLSFLLLPVLFPVSSLSVSSACHGDTLAVYRLELRTFWDEETFPKQFPQWRPNAQWSKTVGYSHAPNMSLFSVGSLVGEGVRQFVETGDSEVLDREARNRTFLDAISSPPITQGLGHSYTNVFVDGNHSLVSVITKIVPSPDWFVGLDSLQLCQEGSLIESFATEVFPLDAGTDNGFTFTSPNWETEPRAEVFAISNTIPSHPAGSFYYPDLPRLPRLAQYSLVKLREYEMQEEFTDMGRDASSYKYSVSAVDSQPEEGILEFVPVSESRRGSPTEADTIILSNEIPVYPPAQPPSSTPRTRNRVRTLGGRLKKGFRSSSSVRGYHASTSPDQFLKKRYSSAVLSKAQSRLFPGISIQERPQTKEALYSEILASYSGNRKKTRSRHGRKRLRRKKRKNPRPRNCQVTQWGDWGSCSKSCGIGEAVRKRTVRQEPRHGGVVCPSLTDYKWCGSARNCKEGYFEW